MSGQRLDKLMKRQLGVSLIELMISIVVALLLLAGLIQVYLSSKQSYNAQEQLARMQESGRFAMDLITGDLRRAGYWGGTVDLGRITGLPGPLDLASYGHTCADGTWGRMIRWRVGGLDNAKGAYNCAASYDATTASDILAVRYAGATPIDPAVTPLNAAGLYLRDNTESGVIMTGATAGDPANTPPAVDGDAVIAQVRPVNVHAYFVGDSGRTCPNGDAIPALMRVRLDNATGLPVEEEIASGVEHLEVQYLLGDQYLDAGAIAGDDWLNVSAVRVWLLVRGECAEPGLVNTTAYAMGNRNIAAENVRRQLYVSTVMLRNTVVGE
jgi:type IV pilus assembly protein PilW